MDKMIEGYILLAKRTETLKSDETMLNYGLENLATLKKLLHEKEKEFCIQDINLASKYNIKDSLRSRCFNLQAHLFHYKCIIECLTDDIFSMENTLITDDEYVGFSLLYRDAVHGIIQSIKINQHRNELILGMQTEEAKAYVSDLEAKWKSEHQDRRKLIKRLISDHESILKSKLCKNLESQQKLLQQRYQTINHMVSILS